MAQTASAHKPEVTFKNYNSEDAAKYAKYRPLYNPKLIELVMDIHTSTGGQQKTLLDVGCGPALSTRQLCTQFEQVFGVDASESMIETARGVPCPSSTGTQASFDVCSSEDIDQKFGPESIDLITVATAAHWFDMPRFYAAASKVLKPNGSLAMWSGGSGYVDPRTTPNAEKVQQVWNELELEILRPFEEPGNRLCRELYENLPMPWTIDVDDAAMRQFDKARSIRREFNRDGKPEDDGMLKDTKGYMKYFRLTTAQAAAMFGTASPVTRWRQAHQKQLDKGEIEDCIARMTRTTQEELTKGLNGEHRDWLDVAIAFVLIVIKKNGPE